jgi:hypothetical protein
LSWNREHNTYSRRKHHRDACPGDEAHRFGFVSVVGPHASRTTTLSESFLLLMMTASERVATFLLEMAERIHSGGEVQLPMSRLDIADHLGLTIETVSRTIAELEKHSAIALPAPRQIVLRNPAVLKQLVLGNRRALRNRPAQQED